MSVMCVVRRGLCPRRQRGAQVRGQLWRQLAFEGFRHCQGPTLSLQCLSLSPFILILDSLSPFTIAQTVIMLCCVLTQGLCWAHFTPTHTALLSALHVSWSWGVRTYQAVLKNEPLTASIQFIPVWNQLE